MGDFIALIAQITGGAVLNWLMQLLNMKEDQWRGQEGRWILVFFALLIYLFILSTLAIFVFKLLNKMLGVD